MFHFKYGFKLNPFLCALLPLALHGMASAQAQLPTNGVVVGGMANIMNPQTAGDSLDIQQLTPNAIINWDEFSIGVGQEVRFFQPSASSVVLNRVVLDNPSLIQGNLLANGRVFLINPNGILFGNQGLVNVGALLATTFDISDQDFLDGSYRFEDSAFRANPGFDIQNDGSIVALGQDQGGELLGQGFVVLAGQSVANTGHVSVSPDGNIVLASGSAVTVNLDQEGLAAYELTASQVALANRNIGVVNAGTLSTEGGGDIFLESAAANRLQFGILNSGTIRANAIAENFIGGVFLVATGPIYHSGVIDVSGGVDPSTDDFVDAGTVSIQSDSSVFICGSSGSCTPEPDPGLTPLNGGSSGAILANTGVFLFNPTPPDADMPAPGSVFITGSEVIFSDALIDSAGEVRIVATEGSVRDIGFANPDTEATGSAISGNSLGVQAAGSVDFSETQLRAGTGETFIGGDPELIERLADLDGQNVPPPVVDGIETDDGYGGENGYGGPATFPYFPDHSRPNASFISGPDGSVTLGTLFGNDTGLLIEGDYTYFQSNNTSFVNRSGSTQQLFMQFAPALLSQDLGFEETFGSTRRDLNLAGNFFSGFQGSGTTLVLGNSTMTGDVFIGENGSINNDIQNFNYVLTSASRIVRPDLLNTGGLVVVVGGVSVGPPQPPVVEPPVTPPPPVGFPSPLPGPETREVMAARGDPAPGGPPDLSFDLASVLDTTVQQKSTDESTALVCQ